MNAFQYGFYDELEKIGDLIFGDPKNRATAYGVFIGTDDKDDPRKLDAEFKALLQKHKSLWKSKEAFMKRHPGRYVTTAQRRYGPPQSKLFGLIGPNKKEMDLYTDQVKNPRAFFRFGPAASKQQKALYDEVERGLYDDELHHLPKHKRVIYS